MTGINIPKFNPNQTRQDSEQDRTKKSINAETDEDNLNSINAILGTEPKARGVLSIGNGVVLSGKVVEADHIIIHGSVEAEVSAISIEVMPDGVLTGTIKTKEFSVSGTFTGNAQVSGNLQIQKGGRIEGDVSYGSLCVENGGLIYGTISKPTETQKLKSVSPTLEETGNGQAAL